ncbi:MAG: hypothetical protein KC478_10070 [Bacteriovoracaceae bacterium]|nr:hypothetical protein [Bacteriovoracaceae bacterium]
MKILTIITLSLLFVGCGKNHMPWEQSQLQTQSVDPAVAEDFSYELGNAACTTGQHSFNSLEAACEALLDNELNNECVENKRIDLYESHCSA